MNPRFEMAEKNLNPIPIPLQQRWREFRIAYLPALTFAALVAVIAWMWMRYVQPSTIVGEAEAVRANIISILPGTLEKLKVERLQAVTNGQELVVLRVMDDDQIQAEVAAAEADVRLLQARIKLDQTRNFDSFSQLKSEYLLEQFNLELARINLQQAEAELERAKELLEKQVIARGSLGNQVGYDVAVRDRDALRAEVAAREKTVVELKQGVEGLRAAGAAELTATDSTVDQAINAHRTHLEALQKPVVLRSPINGFVSAIYRLSGEKVAAGEPILVISAEKSERIVAWVRQPIATRPQVGDRVEVRRLRLGHAAFEATVVAVGKQLEPINSTAFAFNQSTQILEYGLPLTVELSAASDLIPGEALRLRLLSRPFGAGETPN